MDGAEVFKWLSVLFGLFLGLYWLSLGLRSDKFWDWVLGVDEGWWVKSEPYVAKPYVPTYVPPASPRPVVVRVRQSFGEHTDPLGQDSKVCSGEFEQMDPRTWQCTLCHLLHFQEIQKADANSTEAQS